MSSLQVIEGQAQHIFLPQDMIRFSLPYSPSDATEWTRVNGDTEYTVTAGRIVEARTGQITTQLPSGKIARQVLLWCCTQAKLTRQKTITLPHTLREFLRQLGIPWSQKNAWAVSNQLQALINCTLQIVKTSLIDGERKVEHRKLLIANNAVLWFVDGDLSKKNSSQITLSNELYKQLEKAVPIDKDAFDYLRETSKSPLAIDIYLWLCLRLYGRSKPSRITWKQLHQQFGSQANIRRFKITFREALEKAKEVYPEARILEYKAKTSSGFHGFHIYPSPDPRGRLKTV